MLLFSWVSLAAYLRPRVHSAAFHLPMIVLAWLVTYLRDRVLDCRANLFCARSVCCLLLDGLLITTVIYSNDIFASHFYGKCLRLNKHCDLDYFTYAYCANFPNMQKSTSG